MKKACVLTDFPVQNSIKRNLVLGLSGRRRLFSFSCIDSQKRL
jgi:hypothetical protein